jgi:hypothetical protein
MSSRLPGRGFRTGPGAVSGWWGAVVGGVARVCQERTAGVARELAEEKA